MKIVKSDKPEVEQLQPVKVLKIPVYTLTDLRTKGNILQ